jgi:hypothetical protein
MLVRYALGVMPPLVNCRGVTVGTAGAPRAVLPLGVQAGHLVSMNFKTLAGITQAGFR